MVKRKHTLAEAPESAEGVRLREKTVELSNQGIVEFAYLAKDMIEICQGNKLSFDQANCYLSCFYRIRKMVSVVDPGYLAEHKKLVDFYRAGRELSNDWDRISWIDEDAGERVPCSCAECEGANCEGK